MNAASPRAVVFDWDNTLVDTWQVIREALNPTFEEFGLPPWSLEETRIRVRHSLRDSFPKLFGERWIAARDAYLGRFEAIHLERLRPIEGAETTIHGLAAAGIYLALASNKTGRLLRREVEALGWRGVFGRVVGAGDASADKPDRAPIDLALEGSGIGGGDDVWYVGDTGLDMVCARNAGCVPVLVHAVEDAPDAEPEFALAPPRLRFRDFSALSARLLPCNREVV